jgi:hypothetical protein
MRVGYNHVLYALDWTAPDPTINEGSGSMVRRLLVQEHHAFPKGTAIFGTNVVGCIHRCQQAGKLEVGVHGEKVTA